MKLLTKSHRKQLLANGRNRDQDHRPVVKFFNPCGAATWLFTVLDPEDGDTLFGLSDLGFGAPELGYSSLAEIVSVRLPFGLGIERDLYFKAKHPIVCRGRHTIGYADENVMPIPSLYVTEQARFSTCSGQHNAEATVVSPV